MQQERKVVASFPFNCPVCGIQVVITVWSDGTKECSYMTAGVCNPMTAGCALI
jgi:transcription elongation factor Elf1